MKIGQAVVLGARIASDNSTAVHEGKATSKDEITDEDVSADTAHKNI